MNSIVSPFIADIMLWLMYVAVAVAIVVTLLSVVKTLRMRTKDDEIINGVPQTRIAWTTAFCFVVCLVVITYECDVIVLLDLALAAHRYCQCAAAVGAGAAVYGHVVYPAAYRGIGCRQYGAVELLATFLLKQQ